MVATNDQLDHLVSTYDGTKWNLYINGQLVDQGSDTVGAINFSAPMGDRDAQTGTADGAHRFFQGKYPQVALYTNALTPAQVLNHYCVGELGTPSGSSGPPSSSPSLNRKQRFRGHGNIQRGGGQRIPTTNQWFKNNVAMAGQTNASLTITNAGAGDAVNYRVVVGNSNGTTNSVSVSLTVVAGNSLKWNSGGTSGVWDTTNTADWLNVSNSTQTVFSPLDKVLFDDTVGVSNNVIINGTVTPSPISVNSSTNNFIFSQGTSPLSAARAVWSSEDRRALTILARKVSAGPVKIRAALFMPAITASIKPPPSRLPITRLGILAAQRFPAINRSRFLAPVRAAQVRFPTAMAAGSESLNITLAGDTLFTYPKRWDLGSSSLVSGPHYLTLDPSADQVYPANQGFGEP